MFGHTKPKQYSHMYLQCALCTVSRLVIGIVLLLTVGHRLVEVIKSLASSGAAKVSKSKAGQTLVQVTQDGEEE